MKTVLLKLQTVQTVREFVDIIGQLEGDYDLVQGHSYVDAKSFLGVFTLNLKKPVSLEIHDEGMYPAVTAELSDYLIKQAV